MRIVRSIACVSVAGLMVSACGGDGGGGSEVIPADRLDAALLTVDDFPDGWKEDRRAVFTSRAEGPQSFDATGWCPSAQSDVEDLDMIEELAGETGAAVEFEQDQEDVRRMFHGISQQVWSNDDVPAYFDLVSRVFEICAGESWSPEPDQEVMVSALEPLTLGDESFGVDVDIATPGPDGDYLWASRIVIVVIGSSLMIVRDLDVQRADEDRIMSDSEWTDLVDMATDRFAGVVAMTSAEGGFLSGDPFFADVSPAVPVR